MDVHRPSRNFANLTRDINAAAEEKLLALAKDIAVRLKAIREDEGLSQSELASLLGTGQSRVSQMEDPSYGKLTLSTLARVCASLDCDLVIRIERHSPESRSQFGAEQRMSPTIDEDFGSHRISDNNQWFKEVTFQSAGGDFTIAPNTTDRKVLA